VPALFVFGVISLPRNSHALLTGLRCLMLAGVCYSVPVAAARIYVRTADDGSVSLSNVREDRRYKLLLNYDPVPSGPVASGERRKGRHDLSAKARFDQVVDRTAQAFGVESALLHAVISVESGYNPSAISAKGASGLMQLMPETALRYGVADTLDPVQNLQGGAQYLRDLLVLFNSDLELVLAAYNAGENAVLRYDSRIPPFRETVAYVPRVMAYYQQYRALRRTP